MDVSTRRPTTQGWRSSSQFVIATACLAMFTAGFPVPMLPYMLEERLHNDPSKTTATINSLLSLHGLASILAAPSCAALFDTISNQKIPLYLALVLCLAGTALVGDPAWVLYLGRILQAVAASAAWLACTTMLTELAGSARAGAMLGLSMSFSTLGTVSGPMLGGVLLGWFGYWPAWSLPMVLLILDMIARFVMFQPDYQILDSQSPIRLANRSKLCQNVPEASPFLPQSPSFDPDTTTKAESSSPATTEYRNYYTVMLQDTGMWAAVVNTMSQAALRAAFNATLPVYLRDTFNWGPSSVGAIFFALQVPIIFLSPLFGHLRDRVVLLEEVEKDTPTLFGPNGGRARCFALVSISFNVGLMLGPVVTGLLFESAGYYYMNIVLGRSRLEDIFYMDGD
ncbi:hypothetical protein RIB2604_00601580 [Aspergillus luchuensis]|uniref:MFS transporter n=1 Tax=Aspergillus kawachii TaxID=1069201 RepID=A0A146F0T1_ASPKA|nr:hypothetical protein RIB2604_00601580 [Aspergillus luchuensis]